MGLQPLKYKNTHYLLKEQGEYKTEYGMITCWRADLINNLDAGCPRNSGYILISKFSFQLQEDLLY